MLHKDRLVAKEDHRDLRRVYTFAGPRMNSDNGRMS